jgi:hypothetical protein
MNRILIGTVASSVIAMMGACAGSAGSDGSDGTNGTDGTNGSMGTMGLPGAAGPAGADGATGPIGPQGPAGVSPQAAISVVPEPNQAFVTSGAFPNYINIVQANGGLGTFNKVNASTTIIATFQGHITTQVVLASGTQCLFQVRVDGAAGTGMGNTPGLTVFGPQPGANIAASFSASFNGLAVGAHTLQLFATCNGSTVGIVPNGGGFGENATVLEI